MLARTGPVPTRGRWAFEVKWDGFRAIVRAGDRSEPTAVLGSGAWSVMNTVRVSWVRPDQQSARSRDEQEAEDDNVEHQRPVPSPAEPPATSSGTNTSA